MNVISSGRTFLAKRVFPVIWFGFLLVFVVAMLMGPMPDEGSGGRLVTLGIPLAMAVGGYFVMKRFAFDLADEVRDGGDHLVVRFGSATALVALADIVDLSWTPTVNPPRVVLTLRESGPFGRKIAFSPRATGVWTRNNSIVSGLIERVGAARRGST